MDSFMHVFFASENLPSARSTVHTKSLEMLRSPIRTGRYLGFLPSHWTTEDVETGRLRVVDAPSTPVERKVGLVAREDAATNYVALALMEEIRRVSKLRRDSDSE